MSQQALPMRIRLDVCISNFQFSERFNLVVEVGIEADYWPRSVVGRPYFGMQ